MHASGHRAGAAIAVAVAAIGALTGCPSREAVGASALTVLGAGVVNDPRNKSLRFDVLKFGLERFCAEMQRAGAAVKLADDQPVIGRFFADGCSQQVLDDPKRQSIVVQFSGKGYAWTNVSRRLGFTSAGLLELKPDFKVHDGAMYVYFRPKQVDAASFERRVVESAFATAGAAAAGVDFDRVGRRILAGQLARGFTVIRIDDSGETDFGLGIIPVGERPFRPFRVERSEHRTVANDRTEVHSQQQDYIGAFEIEDDDQAVYLNLVLEGAPTVDVLVVQKAMGDMMLERYVTEAGPAKLPAAPFLDDVLAQGQPFRRYVPLPKGQYYLVLDHSQAAGRSQPPQGQRDDRAARVDYLVQVGDAP
ncbi:MAG: hypothetical protein IT376_06950 [Polyangiaceae bacterium]|nr:hypothetical protein [Polyangiaceae bacterium]